MVAEAKVWVDVEDAVIQFLKDNVPLVGTRVYAGYNTSAAQPQLVVMRIGGSDEAALLQVDCWAVSRSGAAAVANQVATACELLSRFIRNNILLKAANIESKRWLPDEEADTPRYILDITFTAAHKP